MNQNQTQSGSASRAPISERRIESIIGISPSFNLTAPDVRKFEASGISLEMQKAYGLRRVSDEIGAEVVGQKRVAGRSFAGIVLPIYAEPGSGRYSEFELRRDEPDKVIKDGEQKEEGKYLRPAGKSFLAFPPNATLEECADVSIPVIVCEGTKKMLALEEKAVYKLAPGEKRRFLPVAISGVYGLRGKIGTARSTNGELKSVKGLLIGFQKLELKHRVVIVIFDNDVHTNFKVRLAQHKTGETIQNEKGAVVYFVDLPRSAGDKIGIDDLLGEWQTHGGADSALRKVLELLETKYRYSEEIRSTVCEGKLIVGVSASDRKKCKVSAKDADGATLAIDTFNLSEADKRNKFIKQIEAALTLSEGEKTEVARELLKLADASELLTESADAPPKTDEVVETSFQVLKDERVIEQIKGGFAVYNPETGEHEILESVTDSDGRTFAPINDAMFTDGGLNIADDLTDYGTEAELVAEIENYLSSYLDLKPLFLKISAIYILFTYLFDKFLELSYINATGDAGSGKSRFGLALALASRRGLSLITPSAASVFRIVDKFQPTMFLDEFNGADTEDSAAVIQILNAGFQQTGKIPRMVGKSDGTFKSEVFNPFCPKIIGSLKKSKSDAFNSRSIEVEMEKTTRADIPISMSYQMLEDARRLRNKLTLYRLRNYHRNFQGAVKIAEDRLKKSRISSRAIQVNCPLFALIQDESIKREFVEMLQKRDSVLAEEKSLSIDGEIVDKIHTLLFDYGDDGKMVLNEKNFSALPEEGETCEQMTLERLLGMMNAGRPKEIPAQSFGKMIFGLGLRTKKITLRSSSHRLKKALVFNSERLGYLFRIHNLDVSPEFDVTNVTGNAKPNNASDLNAVTSQSADRFSGDVWNQVKPNQDITYKNGNIGNIENTKLDAETNGTVFEREVFEI